MAIQSEISQISYLGKGSAGTGYPVPFYFFDDTDLRVSRTDAAGVVTQLSLGTHYSVSGAGNTSGGSVTTTTAYGGSDRITIARIVPATQPLTYEENDRFPAKSHERGLDRLTMLAQQVGRAAKRCFRLGDSQPEIPAIEARTPNSLAGLDGDGAPKLYTIDQLLTMLSLPDPVLNFPVKTWADDGGRAAAVPDFVGQPGTQQNTKAVYISTGLNAGNWMLSVLAPSQFSSSLIHSQSNDGTVSGSGEFLFTPDPFTALKRGTFSQLAAYLEGMRPSGTVVQSKLVELSEWVTATGNIPNDNTIPQATEMGTVMSGTITPTNAANKIRASFLGSSYASNGDFAVALFRTGIPSAFSATGDIGENGDRHVGLIGEVVAGTTDLVTIEVRAGRVGSSGSLTFGTIGSFARFGGTIKTSLILEEIKA